MSPAIQISAKLDALLEKEYKALLGGDLVGIERFGSEKVALLETISTSLPNDLEAYAALRARLIRNQVLAHSAIEGMRTAITRAKEISEVSTGLRTYRKDGRKSSFTVRIGETLSKRS